MSKSPSKLPQDRTLREEAIRQRAYLLWLEYECPQGKDQEHWFAAQKHLEQSAGFSQADPAGSNDPEHRFHAASAPADRRVTVVAGEERQRTRGRRLGGSLRPAAKKKQ